jgi:hypothetical protein
MMRLLIRQVDVSHFMNKELGEKGQDAKILMDENQPRGGKAS